MSHAPVVVYSRNGTVVKVRCVRLLNLHINEGFNKKKNNSYSILLHANTIGCNSILQASVYNRLQ